MAPSSRRARSASPAGTRGQTRGQPASPSLPAWLGISLSYDGDDQCLGTVEARPEILNYRGDFHGGCITTLADVTMASGIAARTHPTHHPVTASLYISFLAPARGRLHSEGRILRLGGGLGTAEATIRDESGALVAQAQGQFRILPVEKVPAPQER